MDLHIACYLYPPEPPHVGNRVYLAISTRFGKVSLKLTELRVDELTAVRAVIDRAFANALRTCNARDHAANAAMNSGVEQHSRSFRDPAKVFTRNGPDYADTVEQIESTWRGTNGDEYIQDYKPFIPISIPLEEDDVYTDTPTDEEIEIDLDK